VALTYDFLLNGKRLDATIGAMVHEKLEEALDESAFNLPITTLGFPQRILGLLNITVSDNNDSQEFNYLVVSDDVTLASKDGFYEHNLIAVEYTYKLDKMFVSALTFTKPFVRNSRAPFKYLGVQTENDGFLVVRSLFPKVEFKENYFTQEIITIPRVSKCLVTDNILPNEQRDVYIQTDLSGYTNNFNITQSEYQITMPNFSVDFEINVGYLENSSFIPVFKHFCRVIKEQRYTLYDMIQRVRAVIPVERESFFDKTRVFELDDSLTNLFKTIDMPQMFFKQQTARQVLNTMFKYINAISRLKITENIEDELSVDFFNKITTEFNNEGIITKNFNQNAENYGTRAISFLSQTLQSNFRDNPSVTTPANNLYKTVRAKNIQLTQDNFELKLEKPIYELSRITVAIPRISLELKNSNEQSFTPEFLYEKEDYYLDITSRVLEKSQWDLKQNTVDFITYNNLDVFDENVGMRLNKNANIYWEKNSKKIELSFQVGSLFKENLLEEMLQDALNEELLLNLYETDVFGGRIPDQSEGDFGFYPVAAVRFYSNFPLEVDTETGEKIIVPSVTGNTIFRNLKFNVEYTTLDDTVIRQERLDTEHVNYESDIRINNFQTVSDYGRVSRDLFGKLERSGVPVQTISKLHTSLNDVLNIGQIDYNNYIITERKLVFHSDFIEGIYTLTKNHNRLNEFNGINQEYRAFEIPNFNDTSKRLDFYSDYIYIVNPNQRANTPFSGNDTTIFDFKNKFFNLFRHLDGSSYADPYTKITHAFIRTDGFLREFPDGQDYYRAIVTPVVSFGGKNNLNFNFKFDNNQIAGDALEPFDLETSNDLINQVLNLFQVVNYYNKPIRYTDSLGFFDKLWFGMGSDFKKSDNFVNISSVAENYFNEGYSYPLVKGSKESLQQDFSIKNNDFLNPDWFLIFKDSATNYGFSYQLNVIPLDYSEYVIGQNFYIENPLVDNSKQQIKKYLYVYEDNTKYNIFDDLKVKENYVTNVPLNNQNLIYNISTYTVNFDGSAESSLSNATSWAIGDEEGNLYIACNNPNNGFGVLARHRRLETLRIGEKLLDNEISVDDYIESNVIIEFQALVSFSSPKTDVLFSNMILNFNAQRSFSTGKIEFIRSQMLLRSLVQPIYIFEEPQKITTSSMIIQGNVQESYQLSLNKNILSKMLIFGNVEENIERNLESRTISNMFINGNVEESIQGPLSPEITSELIIRGNAVPTIITSLEETIISNLSLKGNAEELRIQGTTDITRSEIQLKSSISLNEESSIGSDVLQSSMIVQGIFANPVFARITTDNGETIVVDVSFIFNIGRDLEFEVDESLTTSSFFLVGNNNEDASVQYTVSQFWEYNGKEYEFDRARFTIGDSPEFQTLERTFSIATTDEVYINFDYNEIPKITVQAKLIDTTTGNNLENDITFRVFDSGSNIIESRLATLDISYGFAIDVPDVTGNTLEVLAPQSFTFGPETYVFQSYQVRRDDTSLVTTSGTTPFEYLITDPNNNINDTAYYDINYQRQNKYWLYLGTNTQSFNQNVNYNYFFDTCSFPYTEVESWIELNYSPREFNPNYVMRVTVLTDSGFFCRYEYYRATPL
jgi:hypothetical protein